MAGITSYGAYVPYYRLSRGEIAKAWGGYAGGGGRSVANWDEDTITMAVESVIDCLRGIDRGTVDGLMFASTSAPFKEKQSSAVVAQATDLKRDLFSIDCGGSLRAGTSALKLALDAVKSGSQKSVLVTASECRLGAPQSGLEQNLGDGAGALLIGDKDVAVEIEDVYSLTDEFTDLWRREDDQFIRSWEERFITTQGYDRLLPEAVAGALKKFNLTPQDFTKIVYPGPDARAHGRILKSLGFTPAQVQDPLFDVMGNTGTAFSIMLLIAALEEAKAGDRILLTSYADGADVFNLRVTKNIEEIRNRRGIKGNLATAKPLASYNRYLLFRNLVSREGEAPLPTAYASLPMEWRDRKSLIALHGSKCKKCGEVQFPIERVCPKCLSKDDFEEISFATRNAKIMSYNVDYVTATADPPNVMVQVDFDGGGRIQCVMTDRDLDEIEVNMPVEMTFRKFHQERNIVHYYWKARPIRGIQ